MERNRAQSSTQAAARAGRAEIVERLRAPPLIGESSWLAIRSIMALRILALCPGAGREPLVELGRRFRSMAAAGAFLELADAIGRLWPESVQVYRPCCPVLSPDEATMAMMVDAARSNDRAAFGKVLDGFVRADRHDRLFAAAVNAVATIDGTDWQGPATAL